MTKEEKLNKIREYLTSLTAADGTELMGQLSSQEGKTNFEENFTKITGIDGANSIAVAVNAALSPTVTSTDDKEDVIKQIIERLSRHLQD